MKLKTTFRDFIYLIRHIKYERFYHHVMKVNGIANKKCEGEESWLHKWSQLGGKVSPIQYRVFFKYIGGDINLVPEDLCHAYIEPILNPERFRGYYMDKNFFDKLFPEGYFPKTILRKIGGIFYDAQYNRLSINDNILHTLFKDGKGFILKPSVDGMSGKGVQLFKNVNGGG